VKNKQQQREVRERKKKKFVKKVENVLMITRKEDSLFV